MFERDGVTASKQEPSQQGTRSRPADDDFVPAVVDRQRAQDAQLHATDGIPARRVGGEC